MSPALKGHRLGMGALRVVTALALLALGASAVAAAQWTDALGRRVQVADQPRRIVSLVPGVTETLFALGLGERVAAVTRFCTFPAEARSKPSVGGYIDPSLEAIVAAQPDLVLASADSTSAALVARLTTLSLPVYVVYPRSFADTLEMFRQVGQVAGAAAAGERLAADLEAVARQVAAAVAALPRPRVLLCVMVDPLVVAGPGTLADDLLRRAGAVNAAPAGAARYPTWGPESLLAVDPEVIVVSPHPGEPDPGSVFARWPELAAVRTGRITSVESDWVHRAGPRLGLGLAALARAIHGASLVLP